MGVVDSWKLVFAEDDQTILVPLGEDGWTSHGENDLQCGPALVQPLVLSPNWWTCIPRLADGSLPWMS